MDHSSLVYTDSGIQKSYPYACHASNTRILTVVCCTHLSFGHSLSNCYRREMDLLSHTAEDGSFNY
jgi:hypothetical protein